MSLFRKTTPETSSRSSKRFERRLAKLLFCGFIVAVLLYGTVSGLRYWVEKEHRDRLAEIRRAGFPADVEELLRWVDTVHPGTVADRQTPSQQTSVILFQEAFDLASSLDAPSELPDVKTLAELLDKETGISEADLDLIRACVEMHQPVLSLLHLGASLPAGRFSVDFGEGSFPEILHVEPMQDAVRLLRLENALAAIEGDADQVARILETGMALVHPLIGEPFLTSQLLRVICSRVLLYTLNDALHHCLFTDAQLMLLSQQFRDLRSANAFFHAYLSERVLFLGVFDSTAKMMPDATDGWLRYLRGPEERFVAGIIGYVMARDRGSFMGFMEQLLAASHLPYQERTDKYEDARDWVMQSRQNRFTKTVAPSLARTTYPIARDDADGAMFSAAIAVERYRLAHDACPVRLDSLVPVYLETVPEDPFDLQPLRYLSDSEGYRIYSIGPNGRDDGGFMYENVHEGDIVFRVCHSVHFPVREQI